MAGSLNDTFQDAPPPTAVQSCPQEAPPPVSKVLSAWFAIKKESDPPKGKKTPVEVSFEKIKTAVIGSRVFIVVETSDLKKGKVSVQVLGSSSNVIVDVDKELPVLEGGSEKKTMTADVGNWSTKTEYSNAATLADKAIIEIELKPSDKEKIKDWRSAIGKNTPKKAFLHLKITTEGGNDTDYNTEDEHLPSPNKEKSIFLNREGSYFELYACYCDKSFEPWEIKQLYNKPALFQRLNCPLPANKKTYAELTTELNAAMESHAITTCLRKAHFLSQAEGETNLDTTLEYADGWDYDVSTHLEGYNRYALYLANKKLRANPYEAFNNSRDRRHYNRYNECIDHDNTETGDGPRYRGRGLIQLTWKDTYTAYFDAINQSTSIDTPNIVASDLHLVCDSAAWYWTSRSSWGNLNPHADADDFIFITVGINGGLTGFEARKTSLQRMLETLKVKDACINLPILNKTIGEYKYTTSEMRNRTWGKNHKSDIEALDD